ncbi:MAG: hypothetical protein ACMZI0_07230 [Symbiopectobacterium sp.]|uniref:hypothetical protein n=1 Tax=Symbiopectobacterium sp. TaxID=2952789 RepID=UPI0039E86E47
MLSEINEIKINIEKNLSSLTPSLPFHRSKYYIKNRCAIERELIEQILGNKYLKELSGNDLLFKPLNITQVTIELNVKILAISNLFKYNSTHNKEIKELSKKCNELVVYCKEVLEARKK